LDIEQDFNGFISKDGELFSIKDTEKVIAVFIKNTRVDKAIDILHHLVFGCFNAGYLDAATKYAETMLPLLDSPEDRANCFLMMGDFMEKMGKYPEAQEAYARAFDLPQEPNETWYYLNNNRAYCLNQIGCFPEAEEYCRAAIEIQPGRHNAYKNLGIALMHLGRYGEAVQNLVMATRLCPADSRALALLDQIFSSRREIAEEVPDFPAQLLQCHELVQRLQGKPSMQ
jgi:tetratricopeptide (TPR) repeat protein